MPTIYDDDREVAGEVAGHSPSQKRDAEGMLHLSRQLGTGHLGTGRLGNGHLGTRIFRRPDVLAPGRLGTQILRHPDV